ncbi:permease [Herbiconiux sp. CPCC 203407]|uniref:Permease n=1 Tax=Herbiconiux oxytropis TaxID=2970915 RepID=A0AA42BTR8_9MICO|nr:FtsX-like permease family protein [Herbiconiux oxytropis]MCS5723710.1 permease [Herbiconiux oxytropis]MCS5725481.1 permease [Herbiconiux oxytropis]
MSARDSANGRLSALWLLVRPARGDLATTALPVVAFAVISTVALGVVALAQAYWNAPDPEGFGQYRILAAGMLAVLVVPVGTLGAAAARLSARRREDRLATLRLMGASSSWVRGVALVEAALVAAAGALLGLLLYLPLTTLLSIIDVVGTPLGSVGAWLSLPLGAVLLLTVVLVAVVSAGASLRRVLISPLGVRLRESAPRMHWLRVVIAVLVVGVAVLVLQLTSVSWGAVGVTAALVVVLVAVMAVLNVLGPYLVGRLARRWLARSSDAGTLISMRGVLESPQAAWRQVSGVALAGFVAVPAGSVLGFLDTVQRLSDAVTTEQILFFGDIRLVVVAAVAVSFLLVACSVGVTQAAAVMERRALFVGLDRLGMPFSVMDRARHLSVSTPLLVAAIVPSLIAALLVAPVVGISVVTAPLFIVTVAGCIVAGVVLVQLGVVATAPVLRRVLTQPDRAL